MLDDESAGWQDWFATSGVTPLAITYEELSGDPSAVLTAVLRHLGAPAGDLPVPGTARMTSEVNAEWSARFRVEVGRRS
jgi:LPS sulfotransferase NodH